MSDTYNRNILSELVSNPKKFLLGNILLPPDILTTANLRSFDFNPFTGFEGGATTYLGTAGTGIPAYYLPWGENSGYNVVVEDQAEIMLTAKLSGCAVGYVRASDASGAVRVSHHNIVDDNTGRTNHGEMQASLAFAGKNAVHRNSYREGDGPNGGENCAFFYGVRSSAGCFGGAKWRFYLQKVEYCYDLGYNIMSVTEI